MTSKSAFGPTPGRRVAPTFGAMLKRSLLIAAAALALAAPAHAASVAYIDDNNLWLSSPDGAQKVQLTQGGTSDYPWGSPSQGPDGVTVVAHNDTFDDNGTATHRPVLYRYGANGKLEAANVMPVYAGATIPVYPIGLDMDWSSNAVAYGYSYCGFACKTTYKGFWLTFSDQQSAYPSNPQGQSDAYFPTFYGKRVVSSDSGGRIFVQPHVNEAPFTSSYQMWLSFDGFRLSRAEVSMTGNLVAVEWTAYDPSTYAVTGEGISIGRHQGQVPSALSDICDLETAANPVQLTFSYDGTQMAWKDDEGVKVAGVPNLAAGTQTCTLTAPPVVISATGRMPHFGGADVAAILKAQAPAAPAPGPTTPGGDQPQPGTGPAQPVTSAPKLAIKVPAKLSRKAFAKGIVVQVTGAGAGKIAASASVPAGLARKAGLTGKRAGKASLASAAAAKSVVIARGGASGGGAVVKVKLAPTRAAKRAAARLGKAVVTITVSQGSAVAKATLKLS
jgi:hypothetical protein